MSQFHDHVPGAADPLRDDLPDPTGPSSSMLGARLVTGVLSGILIVVGLLVLAKVLALSAGVGIVALSLGASGLLLVLVLPSLAQQSAARS